MASADSQLFSPARRARCRTHSIELHARRHHAVRRPLLHEARHRRDAGHRRPGPCAPAGPQAHPRPERLGPAAAPAWSPGWGGGPGEGTGPGGHRRAPSTFWASGNGQPGPDRGRAVSQCRWVRGPLKWGTRLGGLGAWESPVAHFYPLPIGRVALSHGGVTSKGPPQTVPPFHPPSLLVPPSRRGQGVCAPGFVYRNHLHPLALGPAPAVGDEDGHKWHVLGAGSRPTSQTAVPQHARSSLLSRGWISPLPDIKAGYKPKMEQPCPISVCPRQGQPKKQTPLPLKQSRAVTASGPGTLFVLTLRVSQ